MQIGANGTTFFFLYFDYRTWFKICVKRESTYVVLLNHIVTKKMYTIVAPRNISIRLFIVHSRMTNGISKLYYSKYWGLGHICLFWKCGPLFDHHKKYLQNHLRHPRQNQGCGSALISFFLVANPDGDPNPGLFVL
jgi:hypothetical protein